MNDEDEVKDISEPEFTGDTYNTGIPNSGFFPLEVFQRHSGKVLSFLPSFHPLLIY